MADIKNQKLLYHLTELSNIPSILVKGLLPRKDIKHFVDVADGEIIESRKKLGLENYVPFHFFGGNPFDGKVQLDHREKKFVLISVKRTIAENGNWLVIPRHPLANADIELLNYKGGIDSIDWSLMNMRDYSNHESKSVCMAECLSPIIVESNNIFCFYVSCADGQRTVRELLDAAGLKKHVNINSWMFIK